MAPWLAWMWIVAPPVLLLFALLKALLELATPQPTPASRDAEDHPPEPS